MIQIQVIRTLGVVAVIGVVGIITLAYTGRPSDSLVALIGGAIGALSSMLADMKTGTK